MSNLNAEEFDFLIFPGGFGVAKNFCDFYKENENMKVEEGVKNIILKFHSLKKPIGATCIAPILLAKTIKGCKLTLGKKADDFPY